MFKRVKTWDPSWEGMIEYNTAIVDGRCVKRADGACRIIKDKKIVCVDHGAPIFFWSNCTWVRGEVHSDSCWDTARDLIAATVYRAT